MGCDDHSTGQDRTECWKVSCPAWVSDARETVAMSGSAHHTWGQAAGRATGRWRKQVEVVVAARDARPCVLAVV